VSPEPAQSEAGAAVIATLLRPVDPITPDTSVAQAADLIQSPAYAALLCLPVVDDGVPLGTISRHQLTRIFTHRFGRELYGNRPVAEVMNRSPLVVAESMHVDPAAQYVAAKLGTPITEDFIVTRDDRYTGMGVVLDLLAATQRRVAHNAARLSEAYTQLKSSQAALVQSEKMASLGQMVAGVAHELNTPLGYVRNNVELLQGILAQLKDVLGDYDSLAAMLTDAAADEAELARQLQKASAAAAELREARLLEDTEGLLGDTLFGVDTIKELVVNLRNFSRMDAAKVAEISLNDCLDQTLVIANNVLKNRVEVIRRYGDIPPVTCSPSQINQVFLNMMTNAAQAIEHEGGKLMLKTEADGDWVRVTLQDNGKGIPKEHLARIFDPFFTTKAVGQGTGLGLSISYQIVQAHGGNIQVASVPGTGTRFIVSLPVAPARSGARAAPASAAAAVPRLAAQTKGG
jgi:signal transduction histidine kinase